MAQAYRGERLAAMDRKLVKYLLNYVTMMMTISSVLLTVDGSPEALEKRAALWSWLKAENPGWYSAIRYPVDRDVRQPARRVRAAAERPELPPRPADL